METTTDKRQPTAALICGVVGVFAATYVYWLVVPGVILGLAAIALGWRVRRQGTSEGGSVAIALGIVAVLLVPSVLFVVETESDYARDCALNSSNC